MTPDLTQARSHYRRQSRIAQAAVRAVRALLRREPKAIPRLVASYQLAAATASVNTVAGWADDTPVTRPTAFAGWSADGYPIDALLGPLVDQMLKQVDADAQAELYRLDRAVQSHVADAGRTASQVEFVARPLWQNYVRMLTPPSCARCAILAGRIYRDLEAFKRHPGCDCVMVPVQDWESAHDEGLVVSFQQAFEAGDVRGLSKADEQAIRDGAQPHVVVNAYRGLGAPGITAAQKVTLYGRRAKITTDSTTRRSAWRKAHPNLPVRLRPESIYEHAKDREDAIRLLRLYGYLSS